MGKGDKKFKKKVKFSWEVLGTQDQRPKCFLLIIQQ